MSGFESIRQKIEAHADKCGLLTLKKLAACFEVNYSTAVRWSKQTAFPRACRLGARRAWTVDELAWWVVRERE